MERIAVTGKRTDLQSPAGDRVPELIQGTGAAQQLSRLALSVTDVATRGELHVLAPRFPCVIQSFLQRSLGKEHGKDADFHSPFLSRKHWASIARSDHNGLMQV